MDQKEILEALAVHEMTMIEFCASGVHTCDEYDLSAEIADLLMRIDQPTAVQRLSLESLVLAVGDYEKNITRMEIKPRDPDIVNPGWKRHDDWQYEEDWNSPRWRRKIAKIDKQIGQNRKDYGFIECPKCATIHTGLTLSCRECEYKAKPR